MKYSALAAVFMLFPITIVATESTESGSEAPEIAAAKPEGKGFFAGLKIGSHIHNLPDELGAVGGVVLGYGSFRTSFELDINSSVYNLAENRCLSNNPNNCDPDMSYVVGGFYAVNRHSFSSYPSAYAKLRLGFVEQSVSTATEENGIDTTTMASAGWGISAGLGLGYRVSQKFHVEVDYTKIDADVASLTALASFKF